MKPVAEALSKTLFWDVNPEKLDWERNGQFIIERTLVRGGMKDVKIIFSNYTRSAIIEAVQKSRDLDPITHNFCAHYFNIPKSSMHAPSQYY